MLQLSTLPDLLALAASKNHVDGEAMEMKRELATVVLCPHCGKPVNVKIALETEVSFKKVEPPKEFKAPQLIMLYAPVNGGREKANGCMLSDLKDENFSSPYRSENIHPLDLGEEI